MKKAAVAVIALFALIQLFTSPAQAGQFGDLLIELETSVFYSAQSDEWRSRRNGWITEVRGAGDNLSALKRLLIEFETHLNFSAQASTWRARRSGWLQAVKSAGSMSELARQLIQCETAISYSAQAAAWRQRRPQWIRRVSGLN